MKELFILLGIILVCTIVMVLYTAILLGAKSEDEMNKIFKKEKK